MFLVRWLPTFLTFPIGGWLAIETIGSMEGPLTAVLGGLVVGVFIGIGQWLVLRHRGIGLSWALTSMLATAAGLAAAILVTDAATTQGALVVLGVISGAVVGAAQSRLLDGLRRQIVWTLVVSGSWGAGWLVSANVIVDAERSFYVFGASGALLVTVATGLVLPRLLATVDPSATDVTVAGPIAVTP